jgi:hypothetical protein
MLRRGHQPTLRWGPNQQTGESAAARSIMHDEPSVMSNEGHRFHRIIPMDKCQAPRCKMWEHKNVLDPGEPDWDFTKHLEGDRLPNTQLRQLLESPTITLQPDSLRHRFIPRNLCKSNRCTEETHSYDEQDLTAPPIPVTPPPEYQRRIFTAPMIEAENNEFRTEIQKAEEAIETLVGLYDRERGMRFHVGTKLDGCLCTLDVKINPHRTKPENRFTMELKVRTLKLSEIEEDETGSDTDSDQYRDDDDTMNTIRSENEGDRYD